MADKTTWFGTSIENARSISHTGHVGPRSSQPKVTLFTDLSEAIARAKATSYSMYGGIVLAKVPLSIESHGISVDADYLGECMAEHVASKKKRAQSYSPADLNRIAIGCMIEEEIRHYYVLSDIWNRTERMFGINAWKVAARQFKPIIEGNIGLRRKILDRMDCYDISVDLPVHELWLIKSYKELPKKPEDLSVSGVKITISKIERQKEAARKSRAPRPENQSEQAKVSEVSMTSDNVNKSRFRWKLPDVSSLVAAVLKEIREPRRRTIPRKKKQTRS